MDAELAIQPWVWTSPKCGRTGSWFSDVVSILRMHMSQMTPFTPISFGESGNRTVMPFCLDGDSTSGRNWTFNMFMLSESLLFESRYLNPWRICSSHIWVVVEGWQFQWFDPIEFSSCWRIVPVWFHNVSWWSMECSMGSFHLTRWLARSIDHDLDHRSQARSAFQSILPCLAVHPEWLPGIRTDVNRIECFLNKRSWMMTYTILWPICFVFVSLSLSLSLSTHKI